MCLWCIGAIFITPTFFAKTLSAYLYYHNHPPLPLPHLVHREWVFASTITSLALTCILCRQRCRDHTHTHIYSKPTPPHPPPPSRNYFDAIHVRMRSVPKANNKSPFASRCLFLPMAADITDVASGQTAHWRRSFVTKCTRAGARLTFTTLPHGCRARHSIDA